MSIIAKLIGTVIGIMLYPLVWLLNCFMIFIVEIFKTLDKLVGGQLKKLNKLMGDDE